MLFVVYFHELRDVFRLKLDKIQLIQRMRGIRSSICIVNTRLAMCGVSSKHYIFNFAYFRHIPLLTCRMKVCYLINEYIYIYIDVLHSTIPIGIILILQLINVILTYIVLLLIYLASQSGNNRSVEPSIYREEINYITKVAHR